MSKTNVILKDNFICHLVYDHDFIQLFNDMIVDSSDWQEHLFVVYAKHAWDASKKYDLKNSYYIDSFDDNYFMELIEKSAQIIVHCLYTPDLTDFLFQNQHLLHKVNWKLWGGDLYLYRQVGSGSNSEANEVKRRNIIKNIAYITSPVEEEFKHALAVYGGDAQYRFAFYPLPKDFCEYRLVNSPRKDQTINIFLGNSGYPTNNHSQAFSYLSKFRNEQIKIYCPLSYGDKDYTKKVCANGSQIFGDKFVPLLGFIQFDEYVNLLNTMDVVVMNHDRQQGVGNILTSLYLGKKVYMQPDITTYKCLSRFGVIIYDINEIEKIDFSNFVTFSDDSGKNNSEIIEATYSKENCIKSWQAIFSDAINRKKESTRRFYLINFHYKDFYSDTIRNPSLGPAYILQSLSDNGVITKLHELSFNDDIDLLRNDIKSFGPDLIGCSFMTYHYTKTYGYIEALKNLGIPIVCGGAHVNSKGSKVMDEVNADFLIKGEGEKSLLSLLNNINNPDAFPNIPGLIYRKDGVVVENSMEIIDIEELRFPRYKNFNLNKYADGRILIQTSRGCPYRCTFCQQASLLGKKWRARSPQNIMKELEYWGLLGKTSLVFGDDNLTLDKKRIRKLCELMQRSRYRFQIETAGVRIDNVDYETLRIMKDVGFNYLSFGIESGSDRVLKEIRKGITLNQIHRTLEMSCKLNFDVKLYFIINNRTETYKEAQQSFSLSRQYPISLARFTNLCPFPGTYDYEWILKHGKLLYSPEDYLNNPNEFIHRPIYDGPGMSMEEREQVIKDAKTELMRLEKTRITASANNSIIHKSTANNNVCKKNDNIKGMHPLQKILFVNHNLFPFEISGTPLSTLNHALGITQRGLEVAVLIPNREVKEGFKKERIKDFTIYQIPALDKFEAYFAKAGEDKLSGYRNTIDCIIDDFSPQIVHINDYVYMPAEIIEIFSRRGCIVVRNVCNCEELCHRDYPVISSGLKGKLCPGPSSSEICANCFAAYLSAVPHQGISMELSRTIEENIKYRFEYIKRLYKDVVDKVIFTSEPFRTYFPRFVPIPEEKVIVIPRGFKFDFARKVNKRENIDGVVHFAFIGNIMFSKGIDVVLQAFETVCKAHNFVLHIYGSLVNHEYLNWIKKLQTEYPDKFIYHGQFKEHDLPKIASNIDLCIIPSYFDTYNRVLREFLYLGIPVIVTDFFGAFIVEDGKNGLKIPTGDADTLAEKMIDIIRKPFMIEHLSHGAAQTQIPSLEEETDKLIKTYNDLYNHTTETNKAGLDKMITSNGERRPSAHRSARLIAFYLPQYHPIPENDQWWGKGFTEWTNVAKARPLFSGHYQPHIPADLGFYDLRLPETRESQAELARRYGISGFCYYHYWFNGKRLLNRVFDEVLDSGKPDFPFCLCWANENWTRAWDGRQGEILIKQNYCEEDDQNHIRWLLNIFKDKRYIRIDSKPLMLVYLSKSIPDPAKSMQIWREEAKKIGEELYLCKVESAPWEYGDPGLMGFDACVEFQPDWGNLGPVKTQLSNGHVVYDYAKFVDRMLNKPVPSYKRFPCVTPMWDNSPRRKQAALIIDNSTPEKYERWLRSVIGKLESFNLDDNIVFINAWNEWGEGNHLEPDEKNGTAYLEATQNALPKTPHQARELNQGLVSIVILTFNQLEYTKQCVKSIKEYTPETHEIIFVDNGSTDGTVQWLRTLTQAIENFKLIENGRNLGFAKGCNQGIEASQGAYILLLNNDVVVTQGWLSEMLKCINSTDNIGMVGPMSNAVSGPQLVQKVPYGNSMKAMQKFARDFAAENSGKTSEIMRLVGFCLLIRKEVFDIIGGLDENYISGNYEDDDLCLHSYIAGYRNIIAQDVFIHHYGSMTFKGNAIDYQATMQDNLQYFAGKWKDLVEVSGNGYRVGFTKKQQLKKLLEWGEERFSQGDVHAAIKIFERTLHLDKTNPEALNNIGVIQWQLGDTISAMNTFQIALTINPKDPDALGNLVQAATETERFDLLKQPLLDILKQEQPENPDLVKLINAQQSSASTI